MANPRKFSEKIALHAQKQAEGTAAFEAILREVSATTRQAAVAKAQQDQQQGQQQQQPQQQQQQSHQLHLAQPSVCVYRGRSLPNVNQMVNPVRLSSNSIDLQSALLSLENMKQQALSGQCLSEKQIRDRTLQTHRKNSPLDRHIHRDCSPYGSVYLSPPPDGSWRRASSDSALHSSIAAAPLQPSCGSGLLLSTEQSDSLSLQLASSSSSHAECAGLIWDEKNALRPRSCDVPGINIFPSTEQVSSAVQVHIANSTGSLPNLATVNFSSSLALPLDGNAAAAQQQGSGQAGTSTCSASQAGRTVRIRPQQGVVPVLSSRMHRHMIPAPLILHSSNYVMAGNSMVGEGVGASNVGGTCLLSPISPVTLQSPLFTSDSPVRFASVAAAPPQTPTGFYIQNMGGIQMHFGDDTLQPQQQQLATSPRQLTPTIVSPRQLSPTNILSPQLSQMLIPQQQQHHHHHHHVGQELSCHLIQASPDHFMASQSQPMIQEPSVQECSLTPSVLSAAPHFVLGSLAHQSLQGSAAHQMAQTNAAQQHFVQTNAAAAPQLMQTNISPQQLLKASMVPQLVQANLSQQVMQAGTVPRLIQTNISAGQPMLQANVLLQHQMSLVNKAPGQAQQLTSINVSPPQIIAANSACSEGESLDSSQQTQANALQQRFQQFTMVHEEGQASDSSSLKDVRLQQLPFGTTNFLLMQSGTGISSSSAALLGQWMVAQQQQQQQQQQQETAQLATQQSQGLVEQQLSGDRQSGAQLFDGSAHFVAVTQAMLNNAIIPDIVLNAEDLSIYCSRLPDDSKNLGLIEAMNQSSDDTKDSLSNLSYFGDSFDGEVFTAEDALRLGLDPLELEELQMLADPSIITDSATEDSFRLDQP